MSIGFGILKRKSANSDAIPVFRTRFFRNEKAAAGLESLKNVCYTKFHLVKGM